MSIDYFFVPKAFVKFDACTWNLVNTKDKFHSLTQSSQVLEYTNDKTGETRFFMTTLLLAILGHLSRCSTIVSNAEMVARKPPDFHKPR